MDMVILLKIMNLCSYLNIYVLNKMCKGLINA